MIYFLYGKAERFYGGADLLLVSCNSEQDIMLRPLCKVLCD